MKNKKLLIFVIVILIICSFFVIFRNKLLKIIYPKTYKAIVEIYAENYGLDDNLIFAVIKAESNFKNEAVSNKGAVGVMQLMESTAKEIAIKNNIEINRENIRESLSNVDTNINIGIKYLSILNDKYGNVELALAAYNAGIGTVDNWIEKGIVKIDGSDVENIPYKETNQYVRKILRDYRVYQELYP